MQSSKYRYQFRVDTRQRGLSDNVFAFVIQGLEGLGEEDVPDSATREGVQRVNVGGEVTRATAGGEVRT